jgi:GT2 family glycosyltransferase
MDISIIIPVKNPSDPSLHDCIEGLRNQNFEGDYEVLIIKGGNVSQARNLGLKLAVAPIVAFIDADCVAPRWWLSSLYRAINENPQVAGVGGLGISPPNSNTLAKATDYVYSTFLGSIGKASVLSNINSHQRYVDGLSCHNSMFKKDILLKVKKFDERFELNEDTELCLKLRKHGYRLLLLPRIYVWHKRSSNLKSFFKHLFRYGVGRQRSILTNYEFFDRKLVFFIGLIFLLVFSLSITPWITAFFILLYFAYTALLGLRAALKEKSFKLMLYVPALFLIEHSAYLLGMIYGLVQGPWKTPHHQPELHRHFAFPVRAGERKK